MATRESSNPLEYGFSEVHSVPADARSNPKDIHVK